MLLLLFAQTDPMVAFGGGSGWASFGIVGLVLSWLLLVHLPSKDKQHKDFMDNKDKHIEAMADKFKDALDAVIEHCRKEVEFFRTNK